MADNNNNNILTLKGVHFSYNDNQEILSDINYQYEMLNLLRKALKEEGLTIISVFHDLNLASIASHRLLLLNEGKIEKIGVPQEVLTKEIIQKAYGVKPILISHPDLKVPQVIM